MVSGHGKQRGRRSKDDSDLLLEQQEDRRQKKEHVQWGVGRIHWGQVQLGPPVCSFKYKEKISEPQKTQGVREDRGQRGEPDRRLNSPLISSKSSGTSANLTKCLP